MLVIQSVSQTHTHTGRAVTLRNGQRWWWGQCALLYLHRATFRFAADQARRREIERYSKKTEMDIQSATKEDDTAHTGGMLMVIEAAAVADSAQQQLTMKSTISLSCECKSQCE